MVNRRQKHVYKSFASGRVELGIPFCIREHARDNIIISLKSTYQKL